MEVISASINQVFLTNRVLKIPFFQRGYVWTEKNWERFFNDIANIAMIEKAGEDPDIYFLGSIIIKNVGKRGKQQLDVIDGQQRLTTIVLFVKALALAAGRNDIFKKNFIQTSISGEENPILVSNYNDRVVYNKIINLDVLNPDSLDADGHMIDAFKYFADHIKQLENNPDPDMRISPVNLLECMFNYVNLVVLNLQQGENAQKIFETINCAGIKLTTGEMLKNYLYQEEQVAEYERSWKPVFEGHFRDYWEGDIVKGRLKESHIENFFYRYMLVKMQEPAIKTNLSVNETRSYRQKGSQFEKFRSLIEKFKISKEDAAREIVEYAKIYTSIFKASTLDGVAVKYPGIERIAYLMFLQDSWTMTPYILYLIKNVSSDSERNRIFNYMESYLMRRIICKCSNNNYSDLFSENLIGQNVCTFDVFYAYLNDSANRGSLLMPSDEEVIEAVKKNDLKRDAKTVLYMLESRLNPSFFDADDNNSANDFVKEQVMMDNSKGRWPSAAGYDEEQRNMLMSTLGNFGIVRGKLKTKFKNAGWTEKREAMKEVSANLMLGSIFCRGLQSWDETIIERRNNELSDLIVNTWTL